MRERERERESESERETNLELSLVTPSVYVMHLIAAVREMSGAV